MWFTFIGVSLFLVSELAYDQLGSPTVNWYIAYYTANYLAISLICLEQSVLNYVKFLRGFYSFAALVFASFLFIELSFINMPLESYIRGLENRIASNWALFVGVLFIGLITYKSWHNRLKIFFTQ